MHTHRHTHTASVNQPLPENTQSCIIHNFSNKHVFSSDEKVTLTCHFQYHYQNVPYCITLVPFCSNSQPAMPSMTGHGLILTCSTETTVPGHPVGLQDLHPLLPAPRTRHGSPQKCRQPQWGARLASNRGFTG